VTGKLDKPALGQWVLDALPVIVTGSGDLDRAEEFVRAVPGPHGQAQAAAELSVMPAALGSLIAPGDCSAESPTPTAVPG
jgi:hypothetical protein